MALLSSDETAAYWETRHQREGDADRGTDFVHQIGMLFFGTGMPISPMSPMPSCPIVMYAGKRGCTRLSMALGFTPTMFGMPWPIWFITWWVMWQWNAQSPSAR